MLKDFHGACNTDEMLSAAIGEKLIYEVRRAVVEREEHIRKMLAEARNCKVIGAAIPAGATHGDNDGANEQRMFPVLKQIGRDEEAAWQALCVPRSVPWERVELHAGQAYRNHGQTLERLAERGGLSPEELVCTCTGRGLFTPSPPTLADAVAQLRRLAIFDPLPQPERNPMSTKELHPSIAHFLPFFEYQHLPPALQLVSEPFCILARRVALKIEGPEAAVCLRKLLEAKDCAVRAVLGSAAMVDAAAPIETAGGRDDGNS